MLVKCLGNIKQTEESYSKQRVSITSLSDQSKGKYKSRKVEGPSGEASQWVAEMEDRMAFAIRSFILCRLSP